LPAKVLCVLTSIGLLDLFSCSASEFAQTCVEQPQDALSPSLEELSRLAGFEVLANCAVSLFRYQA
jgi:hypothetical protein